MIQGLKDNSAHDSSAVEDGLVFQDCLLHEFAITSKHHHQLGRLVSESAFEREDPGSNPAADMVDAARNTAWDLGKLPNNYRSNYPTQEWARSIFNVPASRLPSPKPASPPAKVEDQQLRYFLQKDEITSFDAFKPERNLQKQYKNLIISRSKERLMCFFMTDNFSECSLSLRDFLVLPCKRKLQYITSSIGKDQVLRETFGKVQTLQQKNVFLLVDEVQIRPTILISGGLLSGIAENNRDCKATSILITSQKLYHLKTVLKEKRPSSVNRRGVILHHDNVKTHTSRGTKNLIEQFGREVLIHPSCSPDLDPIDYHTL
ncbi:hypothetical protein FHG87_016082 [Trinorchestia longiramus]|nr:hypothetical protein FHG87_016082 [Trinorchestia longiramus]